MNVVLYFGSFNPIHKGHMSVAKYVLEHGYCDELWFVVSPQNPLKPMADLAPDTDRLEMVKIAASEMKCGSAIKVSDVEFNLPKPSYTVDTVDVLVGKYPEVNFMILGGADLLINIDKWKDHQRLLDKCKFLIYPRGGYSIDKYEDMVVYLNNAPQWDYSSTEIRKQLGENKDLSSMVSCGVLRYIKEHKLWI